MNNLPAVGAQVSQSNQLVLSDQEVYVGQEMLDEGPWWSSMILFLAIGVVAFFSWRHGLRSTNQYEQQAKSSLPRAIR